MGDVIDAAFASTRALGVPDWLVLSATVVAVWFSYCVYSCRLSLDSHRKDWVPSISGGVPILGNALEYSVDTFKFVEKYRKSHGSAFMAQLAFKHIVFLDGTFSKSFFAQPEAVLSFTEAMRKMIVPDLTIGEAILDAPWHMPILRVCLRPEMVAKNYAANLESLFFKACTRHLAGGGGGGAAAGSEQTLSNTSLLCWETVATFSSQSFLGATACESNEELLQVFINLHLACFKVINTAAIMPKWIAWLASFDIKRHKEIIRRIVSAEVRRRRALPAAPSQAAEPDLLSELMQGRAKGSAEELSDVVIADYMMSLIFASMSTTAGVLTNVVYDLAGRPEYQDRLRAEAAAALGSSSGSGKMDGTFLDNVPFLTAFIRESVRLASLPIQGVRLCVKEVVLEASDGKQVRIPEGALVTNSGILAHYDGDRFDDPTTFRPERFLDADGQLHPDPLALGFAPFGMGRHVCPGRHFATAEIKIAATLLLQQYKFETVSGEVPKWAFLPTETLRVDEPVKFTKL